MTALDDSDVVSHEKVVEEIFKRQLARKIPDDSLAIFAEEALESAIGDQVEWQHPVIRAYKAIEFWPDVLGAQSAGNTPLTVTLTVLWSAVVKGWVESQNLDDERHLANFIASTPRPAESKLGNILVDKVRTGVNAMEANAATSKVARFLISANPYTDNEFMLKTIGQMLSRDLDIHHQIFCARLLVSARLTHWDKPKTLDMVASYFEANAGILFELAEVAVQLATRAKFIRMPSSKVTDLKTIELLWEISSELFHKLAVSHESAEDEQKFSDEFIASAASSIESWKRNNPGALKFDVVLVLRLESNFPLKGVRVTQNNIYSK